MPSYIQGNLALDQKRPRQETKVKMKETTKIVYRSKSLPVQEKMLYLFTVVLCVIVAGVIVWRYAAIYQMNASILQMQKQVRQIEAENSALKQQSEALQSPDRLKKEAERLGLKPQEEWMKSHTATAAAKPKTSTDKKTKVAFNP
ncbi:septum formation initiator family protein [Paenibacillus hexagrammi]|uniref:Cell division protein FtsL n=1 Tax=Paenibacillus hexagrammi TaxID=2908839 RepID=A0ABY3SMP3_9BACL|nr:septum formation initiator family protein [Paenibacillus sp. YPD9-1]UJF35132.1 septum formation initiator family protein [Paenibacillus sp. YPD9-1]